MGRLQLFFFENKEKREIGIASYVISRSYDMRKQEK